MKTHIASLSQVISAANRGVIQLLPAGTFRAGDGRPAECPDGWFIDATIAASLIAAADARQTPYVIDYEHQTLRSAKNGLPAPASGWFKKL
ncbi:TPA: phage protease, partial [Klebsiella pneumoniae]